MKHIIRRKSMHGGFHATTSDKLQAYGYNIYPVTKPRGWVLYRDSYWNEKYFSTSLRGMDFHLSQMGDE